MQRSKAGAVLEVGIAGQRGEGGEGGGRGGGLQGQQSAGTPPQGGSHHLLEVEGMAPGGPPTYHARAMSRLQVPIRCSTPPRAQGVQPACGLQAWGVSCCPLDGLMVAVDTVLWCRGLQQSDC